LEQARFMDENYVKKVTLEDLMLVQQIKKPEAYQRLLRHLFASPGQEYDRGKIAIYLGVTKVTLEEAMKLIQQTDLLIFVDRFSQNAEPLKRLNLKIYPIDYGLTLAMTKIIPDIEADMQKGMIAESLVAQTLKRLKYIDYIAYMQQTRLKQRKEIDFYLRSNLKDCPIKVKYRNQVKTNEFDFMRQIINERNLEGGLIINIEDWDIDEKLYYVPLWAFMLLA